MKRNKVLLGLYVGLLTLAGGVANAQTGNFYEIGPSNLGGHISSLVVDGQDTNRNTLYAGAATGGLFVKSSSDAILKQLYQNLNVSDSLAEALSVRHDIWHHVPFISAGREVSLPISCMAQGPDNVLYIGTGSDIYGIGSTYDRMSCPGMGLYRYDPTTSAFSLVPTTAVTATDTAFRTINAVECFYRDNTLYLFVATNSGLYRWIQVDGSDNWTVTPTRVFTGRVDNFVVSRPNKTAFFSSGNQLYRLGDVTAASSALNPINISSSNPAFGGTNIGIKLAVSQTNPMYLYAMVISQTGMLDALYVTSNEQTWYPTTTSTVMPLTYNNGSACGTLVVDPSNPRRVIMGGTNVLLGQGYADGAYFIWTTVSSSEFELNMGEYMATVYDNARFVHSGIHQILPVYHVDGNTAYHTVYFATDGGVFSTKFRGDDGFLDTIKSENSGLNTVQINGLAVAPDGSLLMGANANACPMIETRLDHHGSQKNITWFDQTNSLNLNHEANVIWEGNGGAVAVSAFQQVQPLSRRTIFTSSQNGNIGRSYADYLNYTNITTWTSGEGFLTDAISGGPAIGSLDLWETDTNTVFNGTVVMGVDTLGYILRPRNGKLDTVWVNDTANGVNRGSKFKIQAGDVAIFYSRGNAEYPFEYKFKSSDLRVANASGSGTHARTAADSITVLNPVQSRMVLIGDEPAGQGGGIGGGQVQTRCVWYAWDATDFSKVWTGDVDKTSPTLLYWSNIYSVNRDNHPGIYPRQAKFSNNGRVVYISVYDAVNHRSMLVRVKGFEKADFTATKDAIRDAFVYGRRNPILSYDTLRYNGSDWFPRAISNISVDPRQGNDVLVLTFEDYSDVMTNVMVVKNASDSSYSFVAKPLANVNTPAYSAMVEDSTGTIYVGAADGVYTSNSISAPWSVYTNLTGVPVTAIVQQTDKLPIRHNLTHTSINANNYAFAKTKWPRAIYFGTYGRGVFMDTKYVTDFSNEVVDSNDYNPVSIPTVHDAGLNSVRLYPNPVYNEANMTVNANVAGNGVLRIYDLNGRLVMDRNMGYIPEGNNNYTIDCTGMSKGMYLINVIISGHTATTKMVVR